MHRGHVAIATALIALGLFAVHQYSSTASAAGSMRPHSLASAGTTSPLIIIEPDDGIRPVLAMIHNASTSIDMVMYQLEDTQIEQALADDTVHGVRVHVLLNEGYYGKKENTKNDAAYAYLQAHGVDVRWTPTYFALTHQKTIIVDGKTALIMTFNLTPQYYATGREFGIIDTDSADVLAIEQTFNADWDGHQTNPSSGNDLVWSPGSEDAMLSLINGATRTLDIYNEEMADSRIVDALMSAAARGVVVRVDMTYSKNWKRAFERLSAAGVSVRTYAPKAALYIHAKMIIADDAQAFVGSENFSSNSLHKNRELGVELAASSTIATLEKVFNTDWESATAF